MRARHVLAAAAVALVLAAGAPAAADDGAAELAHQAAVLGMDPAYLTQLQDGCRDAGFTAEEFTRLLTLVTRAKLAGLPHERLLAKLEEGLAKRALPERVMAAMEAQARRLRDAKEVVDQLIVQGWLAPDYAIAVGLVADALGAGASRADVVRAVRDGRGGAPLVPGLRTALVAPGQ